MDKIEFGKFIYSRRKKFNLSQQALANELCLSDKLFLTGKEEFHIQKYLIWKIYQGY